MRRGRLSRREVLARTSLAGFATLFALALVEASLHVVEAFTGPLVPGGMRTLAFSTPDSVLGYRHRPDFSQRYPWAEHPDGHITIATNDLGLREDAPTRPTAEPGVYRVLALGDSHTDGLLNNHESWPNVLERLAGVGGERWEVLNAGVTGYQPWHYAAWWRLYGRPLEPDLVLVGFYVGNDLAAGGDAAGDSEARAGEQETVGETSRLRDVLLALRHRCRVCAVASLIAHRTFLEGPTYEESQFVGDADDEQARRYLAAIRHCIGCVWQSLEQQWRLGGSESAYADRLAVLEHVFRRLSEDVTAAGSRLVVVLLPTKLQVEPAAATRARETAEILGMERLDQGFEDRFTADVHDMLENRLGIPVIEVLDSLRAEHERTGGPVFYDADWHINVSGSRALARAVLAEWEVLRDGLPGNAP